MRIFQAVLILTGLTMGASAQTSTVETTSAALTASREELLADFRARVTSPQAREQAKAVQNARDAREEAIRAIPEVKRIDDELAVIRSRMIELTRQRRLVVEARKAEFADADAAVESAETALAAVDGREELKEALRRLHEDEIETARER